LLGIEHLFAIDMHDHIAAFQASPPRGRILVNLRNERPFGVWQMEVPGAESAAASPFPQSAPRFR
jgi:hypothetical protein